MTFTQRMKILYCRGENLSVFLVFLLEGHLKLEGPADRGVGAVEASHAGNEYLQYIYLVLLHL